MSTPGAPARGLDLPELHVAIFAFLLNFVWELWQVPFFEEMPTAPHFEAIQTCTVATLGDVVIALVSFWAVAAWTRTRGWVLTPTLGQVAAFVLAGVTITVVAEWAFTDVMHRWSYAPNMPTLPLLGTGLLPVLQWIVLPPLVVWFVRRQLT